MVVATQKLGLKKKLSHSSAHSHYQRMSNKIPKCDFVTTNGIRCLRRVLQGKNRCKVHSDTTPKMAINKECPVCLEDTEDGMFLLECNHRCHLDCIKGMNKMECPICRAEMKNLPKKVGETISSNGRIYAQEQEDAQRRDIMQMIQNETSQEVFARLPPQMEFMLAMRYLQQLGIPPSRIPSRGLLEIDPESPLPPPGTIFRTAVSRMVDEIQRRTETYLEEDGFASSSSSDTDSDDEENPFNLEGDDLRIRHSVRTIPSPNPMALSLAGQIPELFNTMSVLLSDLGRMGGVHRGGYHPDEYIPDDSDDDW
jgi:hypothetical protein